MDAPELPAPLAPPSATWDESRTAHVVLRAAPSSYATQVRDAMAERAERTWQRGSEWLEVEAASRPITIYLVDWLDEAAHPGWTPIEGVLVAPERALVCLPVSPENPALGLER